MSVPDICRQPVPPAENSAGFQDQGTPLASLPVPKPFQSWHIPQGSMRYVSCSWAEGGLSCDNGSDHPQQLSSNGAFDSQESTDPSFWSSSALHPTSFNAALLDCGLLFNSLVAASSNIGNDYNPDALTSSLPCHWDLDLTLTGTVAFLSPFLLA